MTSHHVSASGRQSATVHRLKMLVVALIISNIVLGVCGVYFLRTVDRKYSILIDQAVPTLNDMQTLTMFVGDAMHSTNLTLFNDSTPNRMEMVQRARTAIERDRQLRNSILKREWLSRNAEERLHFQNAGEAFSQEAEHIASLLESGDTAEAIRRREQSLRPAFNRYVVATTKAADILEAESIRTSDKLTVRTGSMSNMLLGLASWPVILFCILTLVTAVFVIEFLLKLSSTDEEAM